MTESMLLCVSLKPGVSARTFNHAGIRFAEEQTALTNDSRDLARIARILGVRRGHVLSAVRRLVRAGTTGPRGTR